MVNPVEEWVEKAEEDFRVVQALSRMRRDPALHAIFFVVDK